MRVVFVHDWLIHMRGGEKVLEAFAELFPRAEIYTLFYNRSKLSPVFRSLRIHGSFLHAWPGIQKYYRWLLPLMPFAVKTFKITKADVVISSSHCIAKGVTIPKGALHICYCHTPMRYLWGYEQDYFKGYPKMIRKLMEGIFRHLRRWDLKSNDTVDLFISNSENVRNRIQKFYHREARVLFPPLDTDQFKPEGEPKDYYLAVSAFVPYKKIELVIEAFNTLDRSLLIVGEGPLQNYYRKMCRNPRIEFLGSVSGDRLRRLYSEARALVFPTDEDFGIVPLEAQACGTPVIAFAKGGALESVQTGLFFQSQTPEAVRQAVLDFEKKAWDRGSISEKVQRFGKENFKQQFLSCVEELFKEKNLYACAEK